MERLYIVRHGEAQAAVPGMPDQTRMLTEQGQRDIQKLGALLQRAGMLPNMLICSPYARAIETAEILGSILELPEPPTQDTRITPLDDAEHIRDIVEENWHLSSLMLVTHNPLASQSVNVLCSGGSLRIILPPGGFCALEFLRRNPLIGRLDVCLIPDILPAA